MDFEIRKDLTSSWFKTLQDSICHSISELEKNKIKFESTTWKRNQNKDEGGGEYRILKDGRIFDKVGVNSFLILIVSLRSILSFLFESHPSFAACFLSVDKE